MLVRRVPARRGLLLLLLTLPFLAPVLSASARAWAPARPLAFVLTFDRAVSAEPFTGRVYVMLSENVGSEPRLGPDWFEPQPFFALDVKDWKPGQELILGANALGFPAPLNKLRTSAYAIQAVMDFDQGSREFSNAEGNGYSTKQKLELNPASTGQVPIHLDRVVKKREFQETERVKLVDVESKLLTDFHKRLLHPAEASPEDPPVAPRRKLPIHLRAGVILPRSYYKQPDKRYPVVYEVPGFSGTHFGALSASRAEATDVDGVEMLRVVLDPDCRLGHHVFADSANNGPCGKALIEELIPAIEKDFRALGTPASRFLTGHSSGGWSSLWLQVAYPDFFGGVWSTAPDPVDFRDFQQIDLYQPGVNMFTDEHGKRRPLARSGRRTTIWYQVFSDMEDVMGHGGQLASFEAVFSPRMPDGKPRKLWDRKTGVVDAETARSWQKYDIRLVLERNWERLGPKLAGKLHVYMGSEDTFYLEGATIKLKESLARLGSDAVVEIFPGRDHGSLLSRALRERIAKEMAEQFRHHHPQTP